MSDRTWRYYAALAASTLSVLGWLGAIGGVAFAGYAAATGGAVQRPLVLTGIALAVGVVFARVEKRLYRIEERY